PLLLQGARQQLNNIDFAPLIQRLAGVDGGLSLEAFRLAGQEIMRSVLEPLGTLKAGLATPNDDEPVNFAVLTDVFARMAHYLRRQGVEVLDGRGIPALTPEQMTGLANTTNRVFSEEITTRLNALEAERLPKAQLAQRAAATQTALSLGGLLVMLGVGIGDFGTAIEAASNRHLSSKERDELIASASLSALASIALGLQMPLTKVLERLVQRYIAAKFAGQEVPDLDVPIEQQLAVDRALDNFEPQRQENIARALVDAEVNVQPVEFAANRPAPVAERIPLFVNGQDPLPANVVVENAMATKSELKFANLAFHADGQVEVKKASYEIAQQQEAQALRAAGSGGEVAKLQFGPAVVNAREQFASFLDGIRDLSHWSPTSRQDDTNILPRLLNIDEQGRAIFIISSDAVSQGFSWMAGRVGSLETNALVLASSRALEGRVAASGIPVRQAIIYNVARDLPTQVSQRIASTLQILRFKTALSPTTKPLPLDDRNFIFQHLEEFIWHHFDADVLTWRTMAITTLKNVLGLGASGVDIDALPEFKPLTDKVTQIINDTQLSLSSGKVPSKLVENTVFYTLFETDDALGSNDLLKQANEIIKGYRQDWVLTEADIKLATNRLTGKVLLDAAKQELLTQVRDATFDGISPANLPEKVQQDLTENLKLLLNIRSQESSSVLLETMDQIPYETTLAITELTAREVIRRINTIASNEQFSALDKNLKVRTLLAELPNAEAIKAAPVMRDFLQTIQPLLQKTGQVADGGGADVLVPGEQARSFLLRSLLDFSPSTKVAFQRRLQFDHTVERYYDSDSTDRRFTTGLGAEQLAILDEPLQSFVRLKDVPEQANAEEYIRQENQRIREENYALQERQRGLEAAIEANKRIYFNKPNTGFVEKVRYFLSIENAEQLGVEVSLFVDHWNNAIKDLPVNEESVAILRDLNNLNKQSLVSVIDGLFTSSDFGASAAEIEAYRKAGGFAGLELQETTSPDVATTVRGQSLGKQILELKFSLQEIASKQAILRGVQLEYQKQASQLVTEPPNNSGLALDIANKVRIPTLRLIPELAPQPLAEVPDIGFELTTVLAKITVDTLLTRHPNIDFATDRGLIEAVTVAHSKFAPLQREGVKVIPSEFPDLYGAMVKYGLALTADGGLNKVTRINVEDFVAAMTQALQEHPTQPIALTYEQQQALLPKLRNILGLRDDAGNIVIESGLRTLINDANTALPVRQFGTSIGELADKASVAAFQKLLAQIIIKRSPSSAPHDLSVTTEAVLQEVQRGDFSRLPGIYDAVARARLSTVENWQEKLEITP
ncbi:MAG: hypothetical protein ORN21_07130, partial [Methylophilaceae bacterium]|nr:hypothetical protein [Methylophilaceae bacterium]